MSSIWARRAPDLSSRLQGGTAVVTGAGSGIGRALAGQVAARGMRLVLLDASVAGLAETQATLPDETVVSTHILDVRDAAAIRAVAADLDTPPVLVFANAGVLSRGLLMDQPAEDIQRTLDINVMGVINTLQAFAPAMLSADQPSRIVVTGSQASFAAFGGLGAYAASKHAVLAIVRTLAQEWEETPLSIALLAPGGVDTPIVGALPAGVSLMSPEQAANIALSGAIDGRLLISTHDDLAAMVTARNRGIEEALEQ